MRQIGVREAETDFAQLLRNVRSGREYLITDHGKPVARLLQVEAGGDRPRGAPAGKPISRLLRAKPFGSSAERAPEDVIQDILNLRASTACEDITLEEVQQAKREGRA